MPRISPLIFPYLRLSPIAVQGRRFAAWTTKIYPNKNWEILLPQIDNNECQNYDLLLKSEIYPNQNNVWKLVKQEYINRNGGSWF